MRKVVAAIRWRNTLSAVLLAIREPAGQANNPTYRRLQCFFVLTKGMSVVGPRPALPNEVATYDGYQRQRPLVKPGMTRYWQTRCNRDSITFDEWVDLDLWWVYAFSPSR
nr:sugar transferase [uncultured Slackia sp.]